MTARTQRSFAFQGVVEPYLPQNARVATAFSVLNKVRVQQPMSSWAVDVEDRLNDLAGLPRGWDGYVSRPVSFTCAQFTANLLEQIFVEGVPAPALVPNGDGGVQIEWHRNGYDVEVLILGAYDVFGVRRNINSGEVEELELQTDFSVLRDWAADLKVAAGLQAA